MHGYQHKRMGIAAGVGVAAYCLMSGNAPETLMASAITIPFGAMLPDIDSDTSALGRSRKAVTTTSSRILKIGLLAAVVLTTFNVYSTSGVLKAILNLFYFGIGAFLICMIQRNKHIKKLLGFITMHRGIMHTLMPAIAIIGATLWVENQVLVYAMYGVAAGTIVHLIGDMGTVDGAPILWPIVQNANIRYSKLTTSIHGTAIEFLCNMWCVVFVGLGVLISMRGGV